MHNEHFNAGYEAIEVKNFSYERDIARINWDALKMTFREFMDVEYSPDNDEIFELMAKVMNGEHNPSWLKVAHLSCEFRNISRICLAQLTRDTGWIWNSESQMPQPLHHNVTIPANIAMNDEWMEELEEIQCRIEKLYDKLIDDGIPFQDARYIGLHGQTISIYGRCDVMSFIRHCGVRLNNNVADEINLCYRMVIRALIDAIAKDYAEGKIDRISYYMWCRLIDRMDCNEAKAGCVKYFDKVFCNTFDRFPVANGYEEPKPLCNAYKSAWYNELVAMDDSLLLHGEAEMINRMVEREKEFLG